MRDWLIELNLIEYVENFTSNGFLELSSLKMIKEEDLTKLKITKLAHQKLILKSIESIQTNSKIFGVNNNGNSRMILKLFKALAEEEKKELLLQLISHTNTNLSEVLKETIQHGKKYFFFFFFLHFFIFLFGVRSIL